MKISTAHKPASTKVQSSAAAGARVLGELKSVLSRAGALRYPPVGVRNAANEQSTSVKWVAGGHTKAVSTMRAAIEKEWTQTYSSTRAADPIAWQELTESYSSTKNVAFARSYLLATGAPNVRKPIENILKSPALKDAQVGFLQAYDTASEIIGYDALVITPKGSKQSLTVWLNYVHA